MATKTLLDWKGRTLATTDIGKFTDTSWPKMLALAERNACKTAHALPIAIGMQVANLQELSDLDAAGITLATTGCTSGGIILATTGAAGIILAAIGFSSGKVCNFVKK
jgi:glucose-6-phosphate dehydrogenase assembly protein OpcA